MRRDITQLQISSRNTLGTQSLQMNCKGEKEIERE
jgi:hypothetical protein